MAHRRQESSDDVLYPLVKAFLTQIFNEATDSVLSIDINGGEIVAGSADGSYRLYSIREGNVSFEGALEAFYVFSAVDFGSLPITIMPLIPYWGLVLVSGLSLGYVEFQLTCSEFRFLAIWCLAFRILSSFALKKSAQPWCQRLE